MHNVADRLPSLGPMLALVSGLIGALISSALSFLIRARLDRRAIQQAEQRIAYVHLAQMTTLVAGEATLRNYLKTLLGDRLNSQISGSSDFELSHKLCTLFSEKLQSLKPKEFLDSPGFGTLPMFLESLIENMRESLLGPEELARLPRATVQLYQKYLTYLIQIRGVVRMWLAFFRGDSVQILTAESLHSQWRTLQLFFESAGTLRYALSKSAGVSAAQATLMLENSIRGHTAGVVRNFTDKEKLAAAKIAREAEVAEEQKA